MDKLDKLTSIQHDLYELSKDIAQLSREIVETQCEGNHDYDDHYLCLVCGHQLEADEVGYFYGGEASCRITR